MKFFYCFKINAQRIHLLSFAIHSHEEIQMSLRRFTAPEVVDCDCVK